MNEDRVKILAMLQEGKITVDEAARLLEATDADANTPRPAALPINGIAPKREEAAPHESIENPNAGAFLAGARLDGTRLEGAKLAGAFLLGADLRNADLRNADLRGAFMPFADLYGANLQGANLNGAFMPFANGAEGTLAGISLPGAFMPFTRFHRRQTQLVTVAPPPVQTTHDGGL